MEEISRKIRSDAIHDSEIIQEIEYAKHRDPEFDINGRDTYDLSFLMNAVGLSRKELVRYLLNDPNINVNYSLEYNSVFHLVCWQRKTSILKLLLERRDLNVNIQNTYGTTGLHVACIWGLEMCIKELLLDARVNPLIRNNDGKTARDYVIQEERHYGIANMLKRVLHTSLLRIPNKALCRDIVRMIIEEYV